MFYSNHRVLPSSWQVQLQRNKKKVSLFAHLVPLTDDSFGCGPCFILFAYAVNKSTRRNLDFSLGGLTCFWIGHINVVYKPCLVPKVIDYSCLAFLIFNIVLGKFHYSFYCMLGVVTVWVLCGIPRFDRSSVVIVISWNQIGRKIICKPIGVSML